ncbi:rhamnogalacturonan lyase [Sphingobacterium spiritivorum]|uniref:rhamnogalacturonan lyase n=1 Tax=Sphingobacterium spiritivorum TaxID=258 RepID=UPI003DA3B74B
MKGYKAALLSLLFIHSGYVMAQRAMEYLDRGLSLTNVDPQHVLLSWRLLGTDHPNTGFNVFQKQTNGKDILINPTPITKSTNLLVPVAADPATFYVETLRENKSNEYSGTITFHPDDRKNYTSIALQPLEGYRVNDASAADLDGDGIYELILHRTGRSKDNSQEGMTDRPVLEAYKLNGTFLWRIDLGINIREGAHYTQFMVYDLDGDGRAELVCKTADGTKDSKGKIIGDEKKDWRNEVGRILDGPEYLTVFDGLTGAERHTVGYIPDRYPVDGWGIGSHNDSKGNRADRFLAAVAYLDGEHPSVLMCRGYYGRAAIVAWDFVDGKLRQRWKFDSRNGDSPYSGQGFHNLSVADVDNDGRDEIIYGSMTIDDNGKALYSSGLGHGDANHVGDFDPDSPGLEIFTIHEHPKEDKPGAVLRRASDGKVLWAKAYGVDVGRGVADNIDDSNPGAEMWFSGDRNLYNSAGKRIGRAPNSANFLIWWDGDLERELLNGTTVSKYGKGEIFRAMGCVSNNGTKSTPVLSADLFGDWREEVIFASEDQTELRIYATPHPTPHRLYTLMHDPQYRLSIAWQNVGYNQPPHTSYFVGKDMAPIRQPNITIVKPVYPKDETIRP